MNIFIVGVQKCGTTTLASALSCLDEIELSVPKEPMLFSRGDLGKHRSMPLEDAARYRNLGDVKLREQHLSYFNINSLHRIDASTSYFNSDLARERIGTLYPDARIIILVRNPVKRMTSAYWHCVRSGMAVRSFKRELEFGANNLIEFGCYEKHIRKWKADFGRHVHVACTEAIWEDPVAYLQSLSPMLGMTYEDFPSSVADRLRVRENAAEVPVSLQFQLLINYLKQRSNMKFFQADRKFKTTYENYGAAGMFLHALTKLNLKKKSYPPLDTDYLELISLYYKELNSGINDLIDYGDSNALWQN